MAAGVYITSVSDSGLKGVLVSFITTRLLLLLSLTFLSFSFIVFSHSPALLPLPLPLL